MLHRQKERKQQTINYMYIGKNHRLHVFRPIDSIEIDNKKETGSWRG